MPTKDQDRDPRVLVETLRRVINNHCPDDRLFCGTCTEARRVLSQWESSSLAEGSIPTKEKEKNDTRVDEQ